MDRFDSAHAALRFAAQVSQCPVIGAPPAYKLAGRSRAGGSGLTPHDAHAQAGMILMELEHLSGQELAWLAGRYWLVFHHVPGQGGGMSERDALALLRQYVVGRLPTGIVNTRALQQMIVNAFLPEPNDGYLGTHPAWTSITMMQGELQIRRQSITQHQQDVRRVLRELGIIAMDHAHRRLDAAGMLEQTEEAA